MLFSVVIPTLQRSTRLPALLDSYSAHPLVDEVIIVNNSAEKLQPRDGKIRVLDQESNIYVNPAWNLGVEESRSGHLIISNDDISFTPGLIDFAARLLRRHRVGILGPHPSAFRAKDRKPWATATFQITPGFGTLMFMPRSSWVPIPPELLVWWGDNWLFYQQQRKNWHFRGASIITEMSTTSSSPEFARLKELDGQHYREKYGELVYLSRFKLQSATARARIQLQWRRQLLSKALRETKARRVV